MLRSNKANLRKSIKMFLALFILISLFTGCLIDKAPEQHNQTTTSTSQVPTTISQTAVPTTNPSTQTPSPTRTPERSLDEIATIDDIHMDLDKDSLDELKDIIHSDIDDYSRERAVFVFSDISVREDQSEEAIEFLKEVALNDDKMRGAALANIDFIREQKPFETDDALKLSVDGDISPDSLIKIILEISSSQDLTGEAGINHIVNLDTGNLVGISFSDITPVKMELRKGDIREINYELKIDEKGEYVIGAFLKLSLDQWDSMIIRKTVYLEVGKDSGRYEIVEQEV